MARLCPLFSGSTGNSYYIGTRSAGLLLDAGHLSNGECAAFLPELAQAGTKRFLLAHLSRENNTPSLAREAALSSLCGAGLSQGTDFWLGVAPVENQEGKAIIF